MTFEDYLVSKKIDLVTFQKAEPTLVESWRIEFEQIHPNSFTAQKLYLINPIRRKYTLTLPEKVKIESTDVTKTNEVSQPTIQSDAGVTNNEPDVKSASPPKQPRPVFKPKPKIN